MSDVKTIIKDSGDSVFLRCDRVLIEFIRNADSPRWPDAWGWEMWFDGTFIDWADEEVPLHLCLEDALANFEEIMGNISDLSDYLKEHGVFGRGPEVDD